MSQKIFVLSCFLFISIHVISQGTNLVEKRTEIPSSIYIKYDNSSFLNTLSIDDLKLKGFKFLIFDDESLMRNTFMIDLRNIGRRGTNFYSQTYKDYDLYRHFPVVPNIIELNQFLGNIRENSNN